MTRIPVLYLDLDDTLVSWATGEPRAADGAREFVEWALQKFEVRWLTTWCPSGEMEASLLADLARLLHLSEAVLREIRGHTWKDTGSKLNGIAWLEHLVQDRPFIWLEDEYGVGDTEIEALADAGLLDSYVHCNVSHDPAALTRVHRVLARWLGDYAEAA